MYICKNTSCALAISKAAFPVAMNCPVCQQALIAVIQKTELSEEDELLVSNLPYVIAYPLKRMLDEADGRNRLELMAYSFLNLMKYIGLVLASEYFNSSIRSKELNELFRNNLYQPSFGNWNAFIRDAIKILSANNIQWIFPEIVDGYTLAELKNSKKYTVESEYTDEDGLLKLRKSDLTAIGALINFRNRYLGHGMPLSNDEYAELFSSTYPIYIDLLKSFSCLKAMKMIKTDRLNQYLLQGNEVKISSNEQLIKEDSIWIEQGDTKRLPLIPFYIIPGKFNAGHTDKTQVLVYEQNTGQRMVFYSPESIKAEATGEILERLQLLLNNKEKEEPYAIEVFNHSLFIERIKLHNDKTLQGLKKEKKVLEGIYQSRGEAEIALIGWTGASAGFFFLAAEAGSGKTNLLVHARGRYEALGYPSLLIRANRMGNANLLDELYAILNIPPGSNLSDYGIIGTQENPFMILLDGANEHFTPIELLNSAAALADAFTGGGLKIVISWRVNNLDQVPVVEFSSKETLFNAGQRQYINPLAANAFLLKPMNLVEMEGAWKTYTSHVSKQFKPKFSFEDLLLKDKPLVDQLSNPLLLRLCMEIFNNKGLKSKPKGFTNLWKLWWEQMKNDALESEYLQELANLMAEIKQLQVPLDSLFDVPKLSKAVNNLQVDSPHQQLLRKGIISQFFHEGILQVAFTMEAAYHYVLSASLNENELGEKIKEDFFWEGPAKYKLWDSVYDSESNLLFDLIDDDEFPNKLTGFALAQYMLLHGAEMTLKKLLSNPSSHDWEVLAVALKEIESSRPKEHIQLANGLFDLSIKEYHEYSLSLLISLLQHADKHKADELYRLYIKTEKINSDDNFLALSAYHDKYGRNKEALLCLERAIKLTEAHKNEAKNKLPEFYRLIAKQQMHLGLYKDANVSLDLAEELLRKPQALKNIDVALFNNTRGELYVHQSLYTLALDAYNKAHTLYLSDLGTFHRHTLLALFDVGRVYEMIGEYDKSLEIAENGISLSERALGKLNSIYSDFIQRRGDLFNQKGWYDKALEQYNLALTIELDYFGNTHPYISGSLTRIGDIWNTKGDYDKALEYFERAMLIRLQYYGESHPNVASSLSRIGDIWNTKGDYDKALEYFERALVIRLQYDGESHPNVANSLDRIGATWDSKAEYDKALEYYEKSLAIYLKTLGGDHPDVAILHNNIGVTWNSKAEYDKALEYYEKGLVIQIKTMGEEHPSVATSYHNIGLTWVTKGEYDKALEYYEKCLAIELKTLGGVHPSVATSYNNIGSIWFKKGEYDKALEYYEKCLAIYIKTLGKEHPDVATMYFNIGNCNYELKFYLLAIDYFKKGFSTLKKGGFPFRIGKCYEALDNKKLALDYFIQSAEIRKEDPEVGINDESTKTSIESAMRLAKELGKENELPDWMKEIN